MKNKTQVFLTPRGDHYRTRLSHTLEVSQNARTIAKALRLSAEVLYVRAGSLEPGEPSQVHDAIINDPAITERQKRVLLDIYLSFRQQNDAAREESSTA